MSGDGGGDGGHGGDGGGHGGEGYGHDGFGHWANGELKNGGYQAISDWADGRAEKLEGGGHPSRGNGGRHPDPIGAVLAIVAMAALVIFMIACVLGALGFVL